jgi:hypothetical protein
MRRFALLGKLCLASAAAGKFYTTVAKTSAKARSSPLGGDGRGHLFR